MRYCFSVIWMGFGKIGIWDKNPMVIGNLRFNTAGFHRTFKGIGSPMLETGSHQLKMGNLGTKGAGNSVPPMW